jgi:hypothetical protein
MKKFLLAMALSAVVAGPALAEDTRDQAYGKHDMGPSTESMSKPNSATGTTGMASSKSGMSGTTKRSKKLDR